MGFTYCYERVCELCNFHDYVGENHSKYEDGWTTITFHNDSVHKTYVVCPTCAKKFNKLMKDITDGV